MNDIKLHEGKVIETVEVAKDPVEMRKELQDKIVYLNNVIADFTAKRDAMQVTLDKVEKVYDFTIVSKEVEGKEGTKEEV